MKWVTRVSGGKVFVLDTVDWLEHEYTTSSVLNSKDVLGVGRGIISPCFDLYRKYYGLRNITVEGAHLGLEFTPADITLVKVKGVFGGTTLTIPPIVTQILGGVFRNLKVTTLDVYHFDTGKMTDMDSMFCGCQAQDLDVSHFDLSNVKDFSYMFCGYKGNIIGKERFPKEAFI